MPRLRVVVCRGRDARRIYRNHRGMAHSWFERRMLRPPLLPMWITPRGGVRRDYGGGVRSRLSVIVAASALAAALLSGCTSEPAPVVSTPSFATEDEAFAAAEQTYRNYVDALNQVDLSDPATFEPVYAWTTGDANAADRETVAQMHADGLGGSGLDRVQCCRRPACSALARPDVCETIQDRRLRGRVCLSSDAAEPHQVPTDRPDLQIASAWLTLCHSAKLARFEGRESSRRSATGSISCSQSSYAIRSHYACACLVPVQRC